MPVVATQLTKRPSIVRSRRKTAAQHWSGSGMEGTGVDRRVIWFIHYGI
ncbi:hypothetical protein [Sphingobium xenophagum]